MTSYSPFTGRRVAPRTPRLARTLWTMRSSIGKEIVAGIYEVMTGRELRITLGEHLLESQLSRLTDTPLEQRASDCNRCSSPRDGRAWAECFTSS